MQRKCWILKILKYIGLSWLCSIEQSAVSFKMGYSADFYGNIVGYELIELKLILVRTSWFKTPSFSIWHFRVDS